jgi:ribosomal protein L6P/L9E
MQGLGFRFFFNKKDKLLRLKLGFSHYIMIVLHNSIINIKSKRRLGKTTILISSISKEFLFTLICILIKFRTFNNYKLKGIYKKKFLLLNKLKKGKKKALL